MNLARYSVVSRGRNVPQNILDVRLQLNGVEIIRDAGDMEVNKGLLAFGAEEGGTVGGGVHEEVFGEDGGAAGMA